MKAPQRGEVWLVDLGLAAEVRPAVVMSIPTADVDRALVMIVPHTTSARGSRFEVAVSVPFLRAGVFDAQNLVTIPHAKLIRNLGKLLPAQMVVGTRNRSVAWPFFGDQHQRMTTEELSLCEEASTSFFVARPEPVTIVRCPIH